MNHIYRSIKNETTGAVVTVSEYAGGGRRRVGARTALPHAARLRASLAVMAAVLAPLTVNATPGGGTVVAGNVTITNSSGNTTINQSSQNAALNWLSFNIGVGESVRFVQPNAQSVALNRVLGSDPSSILGSLSANGKVFLVNPNGVLFGTGAQVSVGGLVASTRDISVSDFVAGRYKFFGAGNGSVVNEGAINADGSYVALLGASVSNRGVISARLGTVALAAGNVITLDVAGDGLLSVSVDAGAVSALAENGGIIRADGGQVLLTARSASSLLPTTVNNTGLIEARSLENHNGSIRLLGDEQSGTVNVGGSLDASAPNGGNGGFIETSAAHVTVDPTALVTTAAARGVTGEWLIDPVDFTISAGGGDITGTQLGTELASSNVVVQSSGGASGADGDINVNDHVAWAANQFTLSAYHDININATLNGTGTSSLVLNYGRGSPAAGNTANLNINAPVNLPTGNSLSETLGSDGVAVNYSVINDLTALENINRGLAGNYALGSNLDATGVVGFTRIGARTDYFDSTNLFSGSFEGLGHTISNLTISQPSTNYVGLFGSTTHTATIKNLGLVNVTVTGGQDVGGLVGFNSATISNTYVTGTVTAGDFGGGLIGYDAVGLISRSYATATVTTGPNYGASGGGLVGYEYVGVINDSYATGNVTSAHVGGLVGVLNGGTINNSFSMGVVSLNQYGSNPAGLVSTIYNGGTVNNSYWNTSTSGQANSALGVGLTTAQLEAALPAGFSARTWANSGNQATPYLRSNPGPALIATDHGNTYYQIVTTLDRLQAIGAGLSGYYALGNDIDASATANWNGRTGFIPIGNATTKFTGTFDGLLHTISGLYISNTANNLGLFGMNGPAGTIRDVALDGAYVRDPVAHNSNDGALVGWNDGTVVNAYATGVNVGGGRNVGGLVGTNDGDIESSATGTGSVYATFFAGGLVGYNFGLGIVNNTYSGVSAAYYYEVGGLVGGMDGGQVDNSYAVGYVSGPGAGGLVGYVGGGTISNSFWNSSVTAIGVNTGNGTGSTGLLGSAMQQQGNFSAAGWNFTNTWFMYNGSTAPLLRAFMTPLTITAANVTKSYDGLGYSASTGSGLTYSVTPDLTRLSGTISYTGDSNVNVGTYTVTPSGLTSGQLGYMIQYAGGTYTVNPYVVNLGGARSYDGTNAVGAADLTVGSTLPNGETLALSGGGTVSSPNAGVSQLITLGSLALGNGSGLASNYTLAGGTDVFFITPKALSASALASDKVYDGGNSAAATLQISGLVGTETLGVGTNATFNSKNVADANLVTVNGVTLSAGANGGLASNYTLSSGETAVAHITAKALIATASALDKVYDGSTAASVTLGGITGLMGSETLGVNATGSFNSKDVVSANLVTVDSATLSDGANGGLASNYSLANGETALAHITPKALTATASAADKVYDGSTAASATLGGVTGLVGSETLGVNATGSFNSKDVVSANLVTVDSAALSDGANGGLASNYSLTNGETAVAHITPKALTATASAPDKVYDGSTAASVTLGGVTGRVGNETVGANATGSFNSKDVVSANLVTVDSAALSDGANGGLASNYSLANGETAVAHITPKALTATASAPDKVYDGSTAASVTLGRIAGLVGSETLGVDATGSFNSKDVASANLATVDSATLSNGANGGLADNYSLASGETAPAHISSKSLTVAGETALNKVHDGTTTATLTGGSVDGLVAGDTVTLAQAGTFASANIGTSITVAANDTLSGASASNYSLVQPTGLAADITAVAAVQGSLPNISESVTYQSAVSTVVNGQQGGPAAVALSPPSGSDIGLGSTSDTAPQQPGGLLAGASAAPVQSFQVPGLNLTVVMPSVNLLPPDWNIDDSKDRESKDDKRGNGACLGVRALSCGPAETAR